mmetsp:Transcript_36318/g.82814  ORF Transcript_36318/g.82814 Transcript_36318/m.82814 type:complete len:324 (+) Transcript_36318:418-1389(+)
MPGTIPYALSMLTSPGKNMVDSEAKTASSGTTDPGPTVSSGLVRCSWTPANLPKSCLNSGPLSNRSAAMSGPSIESTELMRCIGVFCFVAEAGRGLAGAADEGRTGAAGLVAVAEGRALWALALGAPGAVGVLRAGTGSGVELLTPIPPVPVEGAAGLPPGRAVAGRTGTLVAVGAEATRAEEGRCDTRLLTLPGAEGPGDGGTLFDAGCVPSAFLRRLPATIAEVSDRRVLAPGPNSCRPPLAAFGDAAPSVSIFPFSRTRIGRTPAEWLSVAHLSGSSSGTHDHAQAGSGWASAWMSYPLSCVISSVLITSSILRHDTSAA